MNSIFELIIKDICEMFQYLPLSIIAGIIIYLSVTGIYRFVIRKEISIFTTLSLAVFGVYVMQMLQISFFSREPGSRIEVSLRLLETWTQDPQGRAYVIENIIFFVPFTFILAICIGRKKKKYLLPVIPTGIVFSIAIEISQFVTGRGYFQVDDIVANTIGSVIGLLVYEVVDKCIKHCIKE